MINKLRNFTFLINISMFIEQLRSLEYYPIFPMVTGSFAISGEVIGAKMALRGSASDPTLVMLSNSFPITRLLSSFPPTGSLKLKLPS